MATKTEESAVTEERIAHILHEASAALRAQQVDESASDESKPPSQTQVNTADFSFVRRISLGKVEEISESLIAFLGCCHASLTVRATDSNTQIQFSQAIGQTDV